MPPRGGVAERSKAAVLKTAGPSRGPWVRTPPPPPIAPLAARLRGGVPMRASEWEFRQRFWIYAGIFLLGYALYRFDPQNVVTRSVCAWRRARGLTLSVPRVVYHVVFG